MALDPGTLKVVVASAQKDAVQQALQTHVDASDVLYVQDATFLIYTDAEPATIRDWLLPHLQVDGSLLVVEFERWSGFGVIDRDWLNRRGH